MSGTSRKGIHLWIAEVEVDGLVLGTEIGEFTKMTPIILVFMDVARKKWSQVIMAGWRRVLLVGPIGTALASLGR